MPSSSPASTRSPPASATAASCTESIRGGLASGRSLLAQAGEVRVAHRVRGPALRQQLGRREAGRGPAQHLTEPFLLAHALRPRLLGKPRHYIVLEILHVHVHIGMVPN